MPFHKVWNPVTGTKVTNRDQTSPPPPPETGLATEADGTVILANQNTTPNIPPATPITVTFPGPNEPMVLPNGMISPRWWRFLNELWRRTGGYQDNINKISSIYFFPTSGSLVLSGVAPTINIAEIGAPSTVSVAMTGQATYPFTSSPVRSPDTASVTTTGAAPTVP